MATTYDPIATTTLSSATASITFSSIAGTYTDLKLVLVNQITTGGVSIRLQFNSDTATNYSMTRLYGDGTAAGSSRQSTVNYVLLNYSAAQNWQMLEADIFSYAGSTNKTVLSSASEDQNGSGSTSRTVGLWRSTNAITSLLIYPASSTFVAGTKATLYGIKAA